MDAVQAAVLRAKLPHLDSFNRRRREIANRYIDALNGMDSLSLPPESGSDSVAHLFCVRHPERDQIREKIHRAGVATDIHYPVPDYSQPGLSRPDESAPELPATEQACREVFSLPCYAELEETEIGAVIEAVTGAVS